MVKIPLGGRKLIAALLTLSKKEKIILWCCVVLATAGLLWWGGRFYINRTTLVPDYGGIYTEGIVGAPRLINPVLADSGEADGAIEALVFSGLVRVDGNGGIERDLAEIFEISENKREYLITLKPNLLWHDGEALTVDDVIFTIDLIKNPALRNPYALNWQGVEAEKISERSLKIKLPAPYEPFLQNLTFRILPKHLWKDIPTQNFSLSDLNVKPIGSGPYRFKQIQRDKEENVTSYTFVANRRSFHLAGPYIDTIVLRFYQAYEEAIVALKKKEIDGLAGIPAREFQALADSDTFRVNSPLLPRYFAVFWNTEIQPFQDIKMREALTRAIDKDRIVRDALAEKAKALYGPLPEGLLGGGGNPAEITYDTEKSMALLEELGWKDSDNDGIRDKKATSRSKTPTKLGFELFYPDTSSLTHVVELLIEDWKVVGVEVIPKPVPLSELLITLQARSYRAVLFGQVLSQDPDPFAFWHSSQKQAPGLNLSLWSQKQSDALLEKARTVDNEEERKKLLEEFHTIAAKDYAALFLYVPDYLFAYANAFRLPTLSILSAPAERLHKINEWYLHTKRVWK